MENELLTVDFKEKEPSIIKVIGVGGGGGNAVNHMHGEGIIGVDFVVCNTDEQALRDSPVEIKIQLGESLTEGRGAGNKPDAGREAAKESREVLEMLLKENTKMVFITAGMGGGTGTGAAPVIAEMAKKQGILTVAIVTIPFKFEGARRIMQALDGIDELEKHVDALLIINNEKLRQMYGDLKLSEAFGKADDVLTTAAKSIAEIITVAGYINVDFADVETTMRDNGVAIMGSGIAAGEDRAMVAIKRALDSPLLNSNDIRGAKNILLNMVSGLEELTMDEIMQITAYVHDVVGNDVNVIWGNGIDESLEDNIRVTIIATNFVENPLNAEKKSIEKQGDERPELELIVENPGAITEERRSKEAPPKKAQKPKRAVKAVPKEPLKEDDTAVEQKETAKRNIDNWFKSRFSKIFDNEDTDM